MNKYTIEKSGSSPHVSLDPSGELLFEGVSLTENSQAFFTPILDWINDYSKSVPAATNLKLKLEYLDSGSLGYFNRILENLNELHCGGSTKVNVKWYYEEDDIDMEDYGKDIVNMFSFDVELIPVEGGF